MKKNISILIAFFSIFLVHGQEREASKPLRNLVFIEALGNGLFGSINYERQLIREEGLSLRAGIGFYTEDTFYLTLPFSVQYLIDLKKNRFIEAGIGYTWADAGADDLFNDNNPSNTNNLNNLFLSVGYRKHFGRDWMWKVNFTPLLTNNKDVTLPWMGIAIGKRF